MQNAPLVISLAALLVSGLSLGWNVAQWLLGGARPRAELVVGAMAEDGSGFAVGPPTDDPKEQMLKLWVQGFTEPVIGVKVINRGRAPARIEKWSVSLVGADLSFVPVGDVRGPDLPHDLPAGANAIWVTDMQNAHRLSVVHAETSNCSPKPVRVVAELGTGKPLKSKRSLPVKDPGKQ